MTLPTYLDPWADRLSFGWPTSAGSIPEESAVKRALALGAKPGATYSLAWAMFCRPEGATRTEILSACGGSQFNRARDSQHARQVDFMKGQRADGTNAFFLGEPGSKPGGPTAVPAGRENTPEDDGESQDDKNADRIRQFVLEKYILPARQRGDSEVTVPVKEVHEALDLSQQWANVCQALDGKKFQALADTPPPTRTGPARSSTTEFHFILKLTTTDESAHKRPFVLFDAVGEAFQPVRNGSQRTGLSSYKIKPAGAGNKADEAIETESVADVARAMLVDGLAARLQSIHNRGSVNYLTYGKQKLVRYELDPEIAKQIGVPAAGHTDEQSVTESINIGGTPSLMKADMPSPTNLILYGPPGTGKTFATALEAVRLCGEVIPESRLELMTIYRRLSESGRIEFVTFHQSTSYEDFVEGLRPKQSREDGSAGFELSSEPGVFRKIARRAETSTGTGQSGFSLVGRQVFKMSIGEASNPDDTHLFEEAILQGHTLLGWGDIDWTDDRYESRDEIIKAVAAREGEKLTPPPNAMSGRVQMPFMFRNWVKPGDIIIVSKGNSLFRAIGEVTGGYQFAPRESGGYAHRRAVRWLWVDRAGAPVSDIYSPSFTQKSIYLLTESDLNIPALERYIASQQGADGEGPESFVLIIDEINRANISKVFGELITLLEADKRLGQPNALKVRLPYSGDIFGVPSNLHIVGTMNTADRSIALLDTALRRRFDFRELMPDASLLGVVDGIDLSRLLTSINESIEYLFDREHQIGHAYFINCKSRSDVDEVMRHRVIPLLTEYFFEDWGKVATVLGENMDGEGDKEGRFIDRRMLKSPSSRLNGDETTPRYRWTVRDKFSYRDFQAK